MTLKRKYFGFFENQAYYISQYTYNQTYRGILKEKEKKKERKTVYILNNCIWSLYCFQGFTFRYISKYILMSIQIVFLQTIWLYEYYNNQI